MFAHQFNFKGGIPLFVHNFSFQFEVSIINGSSIFLGKIDEPIIKSETKSSIEYLNTLSKDYNIDKSQKNLDKYVKELIEFSKKNLINITTPLIKKFLSNRVLKILAREVMELDDNIYLNKIEKTIEDACARILTAYDFNNKIALVNKQFFSENISNHITLNSTELLKTVVNDFDKKDAIPLTPPPLINLIMKETDKILITNSIVGYNTTTLNYKNLNTLSTNISSNLFNDTTIGLSQGTSEMVINSFINGSQDKKGVNIVVNIFTESEYNEIDNNNNLFISKYRKDILKQNSNFASNYMTNIDKQGATNVLIYQRVIFKNDETKNLISNLTGIIIEELIKFLSSSRTNNTGIFKEENLTDLEESSKTLDNTLDEYKSILKCPLVINSSQTEKLSVVTSGILHLEGEKLERGISAEINKEFVTSFIDKVEKVIDETKVGDLFALLGEEKSLKVIDNYIRLKRDQKKQIEMNGFNKWTENCSYQKLTNTTSLVGLSKPLIASVAYDDSKRLSNGEVMIFLKDGQLQLEKEPGDIASDYLSIRLNKSNNIDIMDTTVLDKDNGILDNPFTSYLPKYHYSDIDKTKNINLTKSKKLLVSYIPIKSLDNDTIEIFSFNISNMLDKYIKDSDIGTLMNKPLSNLRLFDIEATESTKEVNRNMIFDLDTTSNVKSVIKDAISLISSVNPSYSLMEDVIFGINKNSNILFVEKQKLFEMMNNTINHFLQKSRYTNIFSLTNLSLNRYSAVDIVINKGLSINSVINNIAYQENFMLDTIAGKEIDISDNLVNIIISNKDSYIINLMNKPLTNLHLFDIEVTENTKELNKGMIFDLDITNGVTSLLDRLVTNEISVDNNTLLMNTLPIKCIDNIKNNSFLSRAIERAIDIVYNDFILNKERSKEIYNTEDKSLDIDKTKIDHFYENLFSTPIIGRDINTGNNGVMLEQFKTKKINLAINEFLNQSIIANNINKEDGYLLGQYNSTEIMVNIFTKVLHKYSINIVLTKSSSFLSTDKINKIAKDIFNTKLTWKVLKDIVTECIEKNLGTDGMKLFMKNNSSLSFNILARELSYSKEEQTLLSKTIREIYFNPMERSLSNNILNGIFTDNSKFIDETNRNRPIFIGNPSMLNQSDNKEIFLDVGWTMLDPTHTKKLFIPEDNFGSLYRINYGFKIDAEWFIDRVREKGIFTDNQVFIERIIEKGIFDSSNNRVFDKPMKDIYYSHIGNALSTPYSDIFVNGLQQGLSAAPVKDIYYSYIGNALSRLNRYIFVNGLQQGLSTPNGLVCYLNNQIFGKDITPRDIFINDLQESLSRPDKFIDYVDNQIFGRGMALRDIGVNPDNPFLDNTNLKGISLQNGTTFIDLSNHIVTYPAITESLSKYLATKNIFLNDNTSFGGFDAIKKIAKGELKDESWLDLLERWWFIHPTDPKDRLNIPSIDYPYETQPVMGLMEHPIQEFKGLGSQDIWVSIEIIIELINIVLHWWHHSYNELFNSMGDEVLQGMMRVLFNWFNLDYSQQQMELKGCKEEYKRVFRWIRWEVEKVFFIYKTDEQNNKLYHGNYYMRILVTNLMSYLEFHHYMIVPLSGNLYRMDSMRNLLGTDPDPQGDIMINPPDKTKGEREYIIDGEKKNYLL